MRVLIDARYLDGRFGGIATYSRELLQALSVIDTETEYVVCVGEHLDDPLHLGANFKIARVPVPPISMRTLFSMHKTMMRFEPDAVHSLFPLTPLRLDATRLITLHDMQPFVDPDFSGERARVMQWAYQSFYRHAYPACLRRASWIICVSQYTRDIAAALLPSITPKLVVVHEGINPRCFSRPSDETIAEESERHGIGGPYALYLGSTRPNKNLLATVKAFAKARGRYPAEMGATRLVLAVTQDRFFRPVRRLIAARKLDEFVRVLPSVAEAPKRALLAGASALFFATKYEGFGLPPLEAMALGVPVLAGRSGALPEVCADAAHYVDPFDTDDMAEGMNRILCDQGLRAELSAAGPARAKLFDWKTAAETVKEVYRLLL